MCNNPSYERPVISSQFAFVSVLLSVLSQGSAPLQTPGLYLSRQVCFPSPSRPSRGQLVRLAHHAGCLGIRMALTLLFLVLFGSLDLLIEEPDTSLGRVTVVPFTQNEGLRDKMDSINLSKLLVWRFSCDFQEAHWFWIVIYLKGNFESYSGPEIRSGVASSSFCMNSFLLLLLSIVCL